MTPQQQANKIFDAMKKGEVIEVRDFATKNKPLFIELAKNYIDETDAIEFNSSYSRIRKIK